MNLPNVTFDELTIREKHGIEMSQPNKARATAFLGNNIQLMTVSSPQSLMETDTHATIVSNAPTSVPVTLRRS